MEVGTRHIQWDIGRVDDTVQQRHEFRDNAFQFVGDIDLVAIELHAVLLQVELVLHLRKIQNAGEVEGIIHIEVDLEHRIFKVHRIKFVVELLVVLIGEGRW